MNKFNLDYIYSMRGIAVLMVLFVHSTLFFSIYNTEHLPMNLENILFSGKYGVALFFIVSAYTLFRSLDIREEQGYKNYFIRRFFRIAPLYYLLLIIMYLFTNGSSFYLKNPEFGITFFNITTHFLFINGLFTDNFNSMIGVEWTIFVEASFYAMLPILFIYRKHLLKLSIVFLLISIITMVVIKFIDNELVKIQLHFSPLVWMIVFIFGALIYRYQGNEKIKNLFVNKKYLVLNVIVALFVLFSYMKVPASYIIFSILLSMFFMLNKYNKILIFNNFILKKIGELSFSIYLIHFPIFSYVKNINGGGIMFFEQSYMNYMLLCIIVFSFIILLSYITYTTIEKPFMKLGKNYIKRGRNDKELSVSDIHLG